MKNSVLKFKKVFLNIDNLSKEELLEIKEFQFLVEKKDSFEIWDKFRLGSLEDSSKNRAGEILNTETLETYLFLLFLKKKGFKNIEVINDQEFFIFNDDLYRIKNGKVLKEDLENIGFFSIRGSNWNYPFFSILETLIEKRGGVLNKTNRIPKKPTFFKGKFHALVSLYKLRKNYIGDIVIPYKIKISSYSIFIKWLRENLGDKFILKKDNTQAGLGVVPVDFSLDKKGDNSQYKKFSKIMKTHREFLKEVYITPYFDFEREYRIYFTKFNGEIKIHSMKEKVVKEDFGNLFEKESFEYYKNVNLEWFLIEKKNWEKAIFEKAKKYLKYLKYSTGSLEFGILKNGDFVFFEVNSMSDPVVFEGEDLLAMNNFYEELFERIVAGD